MNRLLYVCGGFSQGKGPGSLRARRLTQGLRRLGIHVEVVDLSIQSSTAVQVSWFRPNLAQGWVLQPWQAGHTLDISEAFGWLRQLTGIGFGSDTVKGIARRIDQIARENESEAVFFSVNPTILLEVLDSLPAQTPYAVILEMRDPYADHPFIRWRSKLHMAHAEHKEARAFSRADVVSFISPTARQNALARYGTPLALKSLAIPHAYYAAGSREIRRPEVDKVRPNNLVMGHVGREYSVRQPWLRAFGIGAINAPHEASRISQSRITLLAKWIKEWQADNAVGSFNTVLELVAPPQSLVRELGGANPAVQISGYVPPTVLFARMQSWTAGLYAGMARPFVATKIIQYMQNGLPLVGFWDGSDGAVLAKATTWTYWLDLEEKRSAEGRFVALLSGEERFEQPEPRLFSALEWLNVDFQARKIAQVIDRYHSGADFRSLTTLVRVGPQIFEQQIGVPSFRSSSSEDGEVFIGC